MGSVKDLKILTEPRGDKLGQGLFLFSDRYSVFDWGEMPDHIASKGASLCITASYFFERLEKMGIKTHYLGVAEDGEVKGLGELDRPTNVMEIKLLRVLRPKVEGTRYNYSAYEKETRNILLPLEIIYRNSLPPGSSIFKRLREGSLKLEDIGLQKSPEPGETLKRPILDVSTKLEETDRYITWEEAAEIAHLGDRIEEIKEETILIDRLIIEEAEEAGFVNEDGKIEFGLDENGKLIVVDALGTLDECRFSFEGIPVSKEIARLFYRKTDWYREVEEAKKRDRVGWKGQVKIPPPSLPKELLELFSLVYKATANEITGRRWFEETPLLREVIKELQEFL